jgi:hypothetical protein
MLLLLCASSLFARETIAARYLQAAYFVPVRLGGQAWLRGRGYEVLPAIEDYAAGDSWNFYRDKLQELLRRARNHEFQLV